MKTKYLCAPFLVFFLTACSAHPGAGGWHATSSDAKFERLEIRYGGNADFYTRDDDKIAAWRCFWGAADKVSASLKCVDAGNSNNEKTYLFVVDKNTREGVLKIGEQVLGLYSWQAPTDPPQE